MLKCTGTPSKRICYYSQLKCLVNRWRAYFSKIMYWCKPLIWVTHGYPVSLFGLCHRRQGPLISIYQRTCGENSFVVFTKGGGGSVITELEEEIRKAWASISTDYIFKLYRSISKRLVQVIEQKGRGTTYWINVYDHFVRFVSYTVQFRIFNEEVDSVFMLSLILFIIAEN